MYTSCLYQKYAVQFYAYIVSYQVNTILPRAVKFNVGDFDNNSIKMGHEEPMFWLR